MSNIISKAKKLLSRDMETIEPFYVDKVQQRNLEKSMRIQVQEVQAALDAYQSVTETIIPDLPTLIDIVKDPAGYFKKKKAEKNIEEQRPVTLALLGEGFDVSFVEEKLKLPTKFDTVLTACRKLSRVNWEHLKLTNGRIELNDNFFSRLINKVYFFAATDDQKARLEYAKKMLALFNEWEAVIVAECEQMNGNMAKLTSNLRKKRYIGGLPVCLKIVSGPNDESEILAINEVWIVMGHKIRALENELYALIPRTVQTEFKPPKFKLYYRTDFDGGRRLYATPSDAPIIREDPLRQIPTEVLDGDFVQGKNGKFVRA